MYICSQSPFLLRETCWCPGLIFIDLSEGKFCWCSKQLDAEARARVLLKLFFIRVPQWYYNGFRTGSQPGELLFAGENKQWPQKSRRDYRSCHEWASRNKEDMLNKSRWHNKDEKCITSPLLCIPLVFRPSQLWNASQHRSRLLSWLHQLCASQWYQPVWKSSLFFCCFFFLSPRTWKTDLMRTPYGKQAAHADLPRHAKTDCSWEFGLKQLLFPPPPTNDVIWKIWFSECWLGV